MLAQYKVLVALKILIVIDRVAQSSFNLTLPLLGWDTMNNAFSGCVCVLEMFNMKLKNM